MKLPQALLQGFSSTLIFSLSERRTLGSSLRSLKEYRHEPRQDIQKSVMTEGHTTTMESSMVKGMLTILNLFGRSPFEPLKTHMDKVSQCIHDVKRLFASLLAQDFEAVEQIAHHISENEHLADITKNDIRLHLPKTVFLPIDRNQLLEILHIQDELADQAEDIAILTTFKHLTLPEALHAPFQAFLEMNIKTFDVGHRIIRELHELLESSFGGLEAAKVRGMAEEVAFKEHEVDVMQRTLLREFFAHEEQLSQGSFHLWLKLFEKVAGISNLTEKLANCMRRTLEMK